MFLKVMSIFSGLAGILAVINLVIMYSIYAGDTEAGSGMAIVAFQLFAVISIIIALLTGFIAYFLANKESLALPVMGKIGLWLGGASGVILALLLAFS